MNPLDLLSDWPVAKAAAGWSSPSGLSHRSAHSDHLFAVASLTKPLFAFAVLVAVEEGTLSLDEPAGPPGATVRHLLSHSSGLGPDPGPALAAPGQRRIYSNHGFDVLGTLLATKSGIDAPTYFHEAVVQPLGMTATTLGPSPARSATSSVDDLLLFLGELMQPTLISAETMAGAVQPHLPQLGGVLPGFGRFEQNLWGLGFEIRGSKTPHWTGLTNSAATFGHFGRTGTMLWVDPSHHAAAVALTSEPFGAWAKAAWPEFSAEIVVSAHTGRAE